jgi:imidazolonepropionase-like amidohydrolase
MEFYQVWMKFLNEFKNRGGKVTVGSDSGFIYSLYGFGTIYELELLQEAGFNPLEVIRSATMHGAEEIFYPLKKNIEYGVIREGLLADLIIIDENPLENMKVLYGTGAIKLNDESGELERVGGVNYTIKDGIIFDAKALLNDVKNMVDKQKEIVLLKK